MNKKQMKTLKKKRKSKIDVSVTLRFDDAILKSRDPQVKSGMQLQVN
jgi:hypothetical protein